MEKSAVAIVIPSHKRADRVATIGAISNAIPCVAEAQAPVYHEHNPDVEIVAHPDFIIGLPPKRQWIYDHFGDVFMVDDDISAMRRVYLAPGERGAGLTQDEAYAAVQETARTARDMGAYLFGFAMSANPLEYKAQRPFRLTGFVNGCAMGLLSGSKLKYPPLDECAADEDYFISCLNAYYHRYCFVDLRFSFSQKDTFKNPGGLGEWRTEDALRRGHEFLRRMFGEVIQVKRPHVNARNPEKSARMSHKYEHVMSLPF